MYWAFLILRYMHILGAITLMGSAAFMRFALAPAVQLLPEDQQANLHAAVRARWSMFVRGATLLLLLSGIANLGLVPANYTFPDFKYSMVGGIKFLLALPIFMIAELLLGKSALAQKIQANRVFWLNVNLALALVMVFMGGVMRFAERIPNTPKLDNTVAAQIESARR